MTFSCTPHLTITLKMSNGEVLTVLNWYAEVGWQLSEIQFVDGSKWTPADVSDIVSGKRSKSASVTSLSAEQTSSSLLAVAAEFGVSKTSVLDYLTSPALDTLSENLAVASLQMDNYKGEMVVGSSFTTQNSFIYQLAPTPELGSTRNSIKR